MTWKEIELYGGPLDGARIVVDETGRPSIVSPVRPSAVHDASIEISPTVAGSYEPRTRSELVSGRWTWKASS